MEPTTITETAEADRVGVFSTMRGLDEARQACMNDVVSTINGQSTSYEEETALWGFLHAIIEEMPFEGPLVAEFVKAANEITNKWGVPITLEPPAAA